MCRVTLPLPKVGALGDPTLAIPNHTGDMPEGTLHAILKQAGVSVAAIFEIIYQDEVSSASRTEINNTDLL